MHALRILALLLAVVLCAATSAPAYRYPRSYPAWRAAQPAEVVSACAWASARVVKSGKQGFGVAVRFVGQGARACRAEVTAARFALAGTIVEAGALPTAVVVAPGQTAHGYVPFAFDNEAAWNRGRRDGELTIMIAFDGGVAQELRLALEHRRDAAHDRVGRDRRSVRILPSGNAGAPR